MPRKGTFRFCAKAVGLTYSCPVDAESNPCDAVWDEEKFLDFFKEKHNIEHYIFSRETHQNGKYHYHCYLKFHEEFDTSDVGFWDMQGVHPNIIRKPGKNWINYCGKWGDYITNFWEPCPWAAARDAKTFEDGLAILWKKRPRDMFLHGKQVAENMKERKRSKWLAKIYYGPWQWFTNWDFDHKALVLEGEPGRGKTQWAKYWCLHQFGDYFYCKNSLDALKYYNGEHAIIFDDILLQERQTQIDACFDVEYGGMIPARNKDIEIPPGPKLWLRNPLDKPIPDPKGNIFPNNRRAIVIKF